MRNTRIRRTGATGPVRRIVDIQAKENSDEEGTAAAREGHTRKPAAPGASDRHRVRVDHGGHQGRRGVAGRRCPAGRGSGLRAGREGCGDRCRSGRQRHRGRTGLGRAAQPHRRAGARERGPEGQARQRRADPQPHPRARRDAQAGGRRTVRHQGRRGHRDRSGPGLLLDRHHRHAAARTASNAT